MNNLFTFDPESVATCPPSPPAPRIATNSKDDSAVVSANTLTEIRKSALSQKSLVARFMALNPAALDAFEERAAILEFDAGLSRADAEREAFIQVMQAFRDD